MINHNEKKVSVSMCVYRDDNPIHFRKAVESMYNQTLPPDEVVLVVDGPIPDLTSEFIAEFENAYDNFKVIRLSKNVGHAGARRVGLENCTNNIVALMDSDDLSINDRLEKQMEVLLADGSLSIVGGQIEEFDDDNGRVAGKRIVPLEDKEIKEFMKLRCPMNQVTVMFKKNDVLEAGGYLDWHNNEDYYLWIRMALQNKRFKNIKDVLVKVRVNKKMYARRGGWQYFQSEKNIQSLILQNHLITKFQFIKNVSIRFIIQVIIPRNVRKYLFVKLFRN